MTLALSPFAGTGVPLLAAATSAPFPPVSWAYVPYWVTPAVRCVPQLELLMWSDATDNVTAASLYGGVLQAFTIAADNADSIAFPIITDAGHGLFTGDGPVRLTTSGTLPAGLLANTDYWIVKLTADTYELATSFANAMASTPVVVAFTGNGTGTLTITGTAATQRVHWHEILDIYSKQIGRAGDGAVALTTTYGWRQRFPHAPMVVAYAMSGTLSASTLS